MHQLSKLFTIFLVLLFANSRADAQYLEVGVKAGTYSQLFKYWDFVGYFDLSQAPDDREEFQSVYARGGRAASSSSPAIIWDGDRSDQATGVMEISLLPDGVLLISTTGFSTARTTLEIERVDSQYWADPLEALPTDPEAYRVQVDVQGHATLSFRTVGHTITWLQGYIDGRQESVYYTVRIVDSLPADAYSPADFNRDGEINFYDVSVFIELYLDATN